MKNTFTQHALLIILLSFSHLVFAQQYSVSYSTGQYVSIEGTGEETVDETNINPNSNGSPYYSPIPIGFTFEFMGETYDSLSVAEHGFVLFFVNGNRNSSISFFDCDLANFDSVPALSPIFYKTEGPAGDKVFKCEFKNVGFANDDEQNDYANFQLWLYEDCDKFECHYGPINIEAQENDLFLNMNDAPYVGYIEQYSPLNGYILEGDPTNPVLVNSTSTSMNAVPTEGTIYTFDKCSANTLERKSEKVKIYPNPVENLLYIDFPSGKESYTIVIKDIQGKVVLQEKIVGHQYHDGFDLSFLSSGTYIVSVQATDFVLNKKIIKP